MNRTLLTGLLLLCASPAAADCVADLRELGKRHTAAGPVRIETTFVFNGRPQVKRVEAVAPDRVHIVQPSTETVIVGNIMWHKQGGRFVRTPRPLLPGEREAVHFDLAEQIGAASDARCPGAVEREGRRYIAYRFTSKRKIGGWDGIWRTVVYVAPDTGLPVLSEVNRHTPAGFVSTFTYDRSINVTAPD